MTSQIVLSGVVFTNSIGLALPTIPGLTSLGFFGNGPATDGINSNRVPGGPAFVAIENSPAISSNFMTVGAVGLPATATFTSSGGIITSLNLTGSGTLYVDPPSLAAATGTGFSGQATISGGHVTGFTLVSGGTGYPASGNLVLNGGNFSALNTQNVRSAALLAAGWSWMAVTRVPGSGLPSTIISDSGGLNSPVITQITSQVSANSMRLLQTNTTALTMNPISALSNFHCQALTYAGGASGLFTLYNLTDGQSATYTSLGITSGSTISAHFGPNGQPNSLGQVNDNFKNTADIAFGMVASGALSSGALVGIYASVKSLLARRGVSC